MEHCAVLFLIILGASLVFAEEDVPIVASVGGHWYALGNPSNDLKKRDLLIPGDKIVVRAPFSSDDYIVILDSNYKIIQARCDSPGECDHPLSVPSSSATGLNRTLQMAAALWRRHPGRYESLVNPKGATLQDAVLRLDKGQLDLSPAFRDKEPGNYLLRLQQIGVLSHSRTRTEPLKYTWSPKNPDSLSVFGIAPGLYDLVLLEPVEDGQEPMPSGQRCWVLIQSPRNYTPAARQYAQALSTTNQWAKTVRPDFIREFLRACLDEIASQTGH